jgi:hypothetical protein
MFVYFLYTNAFLGPLNTSKRQWQEQERGQQRQQQELET